MRCRPTACAAVSAAVAEQACFRHITQAEKGIRKLQSLNIAQSIIDDISAISLAIHGETIVGNHLDYTSIDTSANVRIARSAVMDILFGNDPSSVSFITTKQDIGIPNKIL